MTALRTWPVRTETRERNRTALLEAAAELLEEHGYAGTSLAAVAARAGLTTGAVYSIFGSKVELFIEVLLRERHVLLADEVADDSLDLEAFLDAYAREWVAQLRKGDARKALELEMELSLAAMRDPRLMAKTREMFSATEQRLVADLERMAPLSVPAGELARTLVAALQGLSQLAVAMDEEPDVEVFARTARRLATGLDVRP